MDVETKGELTRGMSVIDDRKPAAAAANVQLAVGAAVGEVRQWIERVLRDAP
jgi:purine nucleosidase